MLDWLNASAFVILDEPTTWAELLGFATGLVSVVLVVRRHIANWPVGIANVILLMVAFWTTGLYADAGLQIVYVVLGVYGWWQWRPGGDQVSAGVRRTSRTEWVRLVITGIVVALVLWRLLTAVSHSTVPAADATTTALSLLATYGQCRKLLESWWLWIAADLVYIPLYAVKHLYLTTLLYAVFLTLCVIGLRSWRDAPRDEPIPVPA